MRSSMGKEKNRGRAREIDRERERNRMKEDVRRVERIGGLHVALFLVLLSPGYNPPRRRWCLYLSRGKPPSVRVSLPRASPSHPTFSLPHSLSIHLLAARSPSEPYIPSLPSPAIHPPSPRHTLCSPLFSPRFPPIDTHYHPPVFLPLLLHLFLLYLLHSLSIHIHPPSSPLPSSVVPTHPNTPPAEGGCALLAPESSRPRPRPGSGLRRTRGKRT